MGTRRLRWLRDELPFVLVVAGVLAAVLYLLMSPGHWRRGTSLIAGALLLAAVFRAALPTPRAGMLVVRGRWYDVLCYAALGALIVAVGIRLR